MTPRDMVRRIGYGAGVLAIGVAAAAVVLYRVGWISNIAIVAASAVPVLLVAGPVGLALLAATRSWRTFAVGVVIVVVGAATQAPLFVRNAPDPTEGAATLRVLQANIMLGEADPDALVTLVRERRVDVLTVQELTHSSVVRLREAGLDDLLPETYLEPGEDGSGGGTGIYSRFPLNDSRRLGRFAMANLVATADLGGGRSVTVAAVHPLPPYPYPSWKWAAEMDELTGLLHDVGDAGRPVVVGGDFNSTWSHSRYRAMLTGGFVDAGEQAGAGPVPTYPADRAYPAVIGIDHIVLKDATVGEFERVDVPGSDHHGLFATVTPEFAPPTGVAQ